jgi:hypothetical protein
VIFIGDLLGKKMAGLGLVNDQQYHLARAGLVYRNSIYHPISGGCALLGYPSSSFSGKRTYVNDFTNPHRNYALKTWN